MIESSGNGQIKQIQKLKKNARFRKQEGLFIVEGYKMVQEALYHHLVKALYVASFCQEAYREKLSMPDTDIPVEIVSDRLFGELSDTVHPQGVLAVVFMPRYDKEKICRNENAALLCLEDIQDPGNLGTMIRTAEGAGMAGVVLSGGCVDIFNPKVVRSTMGALFRVPFWFCEDLSTEVESLKGEEFTIYAAHLEGENSYTLESYAGKIGILIGNEAKGLSKEVSEKADKKVRIPMEGELESLNASVSAALLMYEVYRNRG
ncbi:MAG: RNA methyltransferase [Lachnospiraceae bacterium]|nr:RNA methyltransferase [Lachnospiraceae bacterium]